MPHKSLRLLIILAALSLAALLFAISTGSGTAGSGTLRALLAGAADPLETDILLRLRLPRALAAFGTGAALALAGALMQVLLRNPLADPYVLGTSGGAAVGALGAMLLGSAGLVVDGFAFAGALLSTVLVFALARSGGAWYDGRGYDGGAASRLLLTGIVVASAWSAAVSLLLATSPEASLRGLLFWLMGDFSFVERPGPILAVAAAGTMAGLLLARTLNVLGTGDWQAGLLGVEVRRVRGAIYALAALLTSLAVTTAGVVGFVGLIVPHFVRLAGGSDHRVVIPGSALAGGTLLVLADTLARTLLAPRQLPVGAITAAVGVPAFLFLLRRSVRSSARAAS
jgi:iron complex transport system permease protein